MKKYLLLFLAQGLLLQAGAQLAPFSLAQFNKERNQVNITGFRVLGAWSAASIVVGLAGQGAGGEAKYFHQMNIIWGSVNLLIALPGYLHSRKAPADLSLAATLRGQSSIEKTFIFNAGLDLAYLAGGAWLLEKGNTASNKDRYKGYGKSVLVQGAALLLFDAVMFTRHHRHGRGLYRALETVQIGPNSLGWVVPIR
ncbi:MAG TPA: hypothetical protein VL307_15230 [Chitinophagaceae bacterium]|nr:hypothetical protein [Chitinophagaceae bacterium]